MKLKNIISAVIVAGAVLTASSCEDMFKVDSKVVLYDYENTLDRATDTVYSVLGIIKNMQKIADRSVLLGEVRGDLVSTSTHANKDLAELYKFDYQNLSKTNRYNKPSDYYAVINNCNFFLAHADTAYTRNRKNVFLKEYIAVLSFRAWTYLQLAQIYGDVYFFYEPILSGDQADEIKKQGKFNIKEIATILLNDFEDRFLDEAVPNYGDLGGETTGSGDKSTTHTSGNFFIPVRIIMGDLALWSEQYGKAAKYYHDYLSGNTNKLITPGIARITWFGSDWIYLDPNGDSYSSTFGDNIKPICYIPMEIDEYNGVVSDLPNIFNSVESNDYWYQLTRSNALTSLSTRQNYCYHNISLQDRLEGDFVRTPKYMTNKYDQEVELRRGDLRLQSILTTKGRTLDEYSSSNLSSVEQKLIKINAEKICLYRNDVVYLRLAEALNRAECPSLAFSILKSGLCYEIIDSHILGYDTDDNPIVDAELERAKSFGIDYTTMDYYNKNFCLYQMGQQGNDGFNRVYYDLENANPMGSADYENVSRTIDGATIYRVNSQIVSNRNSMGSGSPNTMGIHSRGCGDADIDTLYTIGHKLSEMGKPRTGSLQDSILAVEEYIIDEMGLETCFEGYRFGDLMRIAQHRANGSGYDTDFFAEKVASREKATMEDPYGAKDMTLYNRLKDSKNWFLPLE